DPGVVLLIYLLFLCFSAPELVQPRRGPNPTWRAVHSTQGGCNRPLALCSHQGGLHIPLSGYGGTSNIILEDQRKHADGYVATLPDVAVGCVSKVCLCVRNTGSRAAFIKAVAFSDVPSRSLVLASVMSLAPSQFVLKERTQEVITILMKSSQREASLCESASTPLATVCLFCGDEVSRQQYRRLLQSKPEAGRKALSENSLLKNIDFNERFLGEESVTEDGPSSTSQVQIRNNASRELNFDLSWPAHCLTITPEHGVIEPQYLSVSPACSGCYSCAACGPTRHQAIGNPTDTSQPGGNEQQDHHLSSHFFRRNIRCSRVSGTLGAHEKIQVPVTFLPRDRGTYVQFWDMECHPVSEPRQKSRIRFQLSGTVRTNFLFWALTKYSNA
ncbi:hypothetical protein GOODEAATRI_013175, partial [Goodea atripinnis]